MIYRLDGEIQKLLVNEKIFPKNFVTHLHKSLLYNLEFSAVLMNLETGVIEEEFYSYVRPIERPILSLYCSTVTGISQGVVNRARDLSSVLYDFDGWLLTLSTLKNLTMPGQLKLLSPTQPVLLSESSVNCAFVTWGNDFDYFLNRECKRKLIENSLYFGYWINLEEIFTLNYQNIFRPSFKVALKHLNVEFSGNQQCGIDDARNTAKLCYEMSKRGSSLRITNII